MSKLKVGIAGTGYTVGIAGNHVHGYKRYSEDCDLVAMYDIVPGRAAAWAKEHGLDVKIVSSFDELLDMVDAVSICTPNYAHVPLVVRALEKGKHVLCEKPLSIDAESCQAAVDIASCTNKISMIGFSYRGIPAVRYMKKMVEEGKLGAVYTWRETLGGCRIANPEVKLEWRMQENLSGTGALADFGCHMLDLCDWVLSGTAGRMTEVQGFVSTMIKERANIFTPGKGDVTNDDSAAFNVMFESGTIASFVASRLGVRRHTIEVYGEGGMMLFRDDKPSELEIWFKDPKGGYSGSAEIITVPEELQIDPWSDAEFREFLDCIKEGRQPERSFERAAFIQEIIDAALESALTGETVELI